MSGKQTIKTTLDRHGTMNATGIVIPLDVEKVFGAKRVPVRAMVNGEVYRGSIVRMGGEYRLGIPKEFRERAGIKAGDNIVVTLEPDTEPRIVELPDDLAAAISQEPGAWAVWEKLSYTHKKEHVRAISEARQAETRERRVRRAVEMIIAKRD
jgi:bifunctional DNA-binding transcriptional regulator/antitoxin component of YhaV-PrlF toxin-antitoxin module